MLKAISKVVLMQKAAVNVMLSPALQQDRLRECRRHLFGSIHDMEAL
jgi:hypothetical protein